MHFLVGSAIAIGILVWLVGDETARKIVGAAFIIAIAALSLLLLAVWGDQKDFRATETAKIPEATPELRQACTEWQSNPDDAPRMCFKVLEDAP